MTNCSCATQCRALIVFTESLRNCVKSLDWLIDWLIICVFIYLFIFPRGRYLILRLGLTKSLVNVFGREGGLWNNRDFFFVSKHTALPPAAVCKARRWALFSVLVQAHRCPLGGKCCCHWQGCSSPAQKPNGSKIALCSALGTWLLTGRHFLC